MIVGLVEGIGDQCDCKERPERCFIHSERTEVGGVDYPKLTILNKSGWIDAVRLVQQTDQTDRAPVALCLKWVGLCPGGLVTPEAGELYRAIIACGGTSRIATPGEYFRLPALWIEAVAVVNSERLKVAQLKKEMKDGDD